MSEAMVLFWVALGLAVLPFAAVAIAAVGLGRRYFSPDERQVRAPVAPRGVHPSASDLYPLGSSRQ